MCSNLPEIIVSLGFALAIIMLVWFIITASNEEGD